jgi:CheY-like chemotaxis protein/nitrogen-specific signal transduction histidine kinase
MNYSIFDGFTSSVFILDDNQRIVYVNDACTSRFSIQAHICINDTKLNELIEYCNDQPCTQNTIVIHDITYYIRSFSLGHHVFVEIQDMNISTCKTIINNVSKEVRSPLYGITGIIDILSTSSTLTEQQQAYVTMVKDCSTDLLHIINNVVDYIKIIENKMALKVSTNDLGSCLRKTNILIQTKLKNDNQKLVYNVDTFEYEYEYDPIRLKQVIIHLLTNAVENTPIGQISLTVTKKVSNSYSDEMEFTVSDNGVGINDCDIGKLFVPFCKIHNDRIKNKIGLGLVISKYLVKKMGGELLVSSTQGVGTTFSFTLPMNKNNTLSEHNFEKIMKSKTVLAIIGDKKERFLLSSFLIKNKINAVPTISVKEAMNIYLYNDYKIDYIILDPTNNHIDDLEEFSQILKTNPVYSNTNVISCGKSVDAAYIHVEKPIDFSHLKMILYKNADKKDTSGTRILIVEDQPSNTMVISKHLHNMGYTNIDTALNGKEGVDKVLSFNTGRYDLILMDIMMPVMNGFDATKEIIKHDSKNIVIGISADITASLDICKTYGMSDLIVKPVNYSVFEMVCEKYL